jgi:uncharacterized membrane protein YtjA (UPF0391 family)
MLRGAAIFAIAALVLGVMAFGGIAGFAWDIAKLLFWIALVIAAALAVLGMIIARKIK